MGIINSYQRWASLTLIRGGHHYLLSEVGIINCIVSGGKVTAFKTSLFRLPLVTGIVFVLELRGEGLIFKWRRLWQLHTNFLSVRRLKFKIKLSYLR